MKKFIVAVILLAIVAGGFYLINLARTPKPVNGTIEGEPLRIGFSLGTLVEERWQKDADLFKARAEELGATVDVMYSGEDAVLQTAQAENLIIQGVDALVVVPYDAEAARAIVDTAHAAGVKVIAYDRMITESDVDLFVTFDSRRLGALQAEEIVKRVPKGKIAYIGGSPTDNNAALLKEGSMMVLQPYVESGDIEIVVDTFSAGWSPDEAYKTIRNYLASGGALDGVVAANDGTAGGVINALKEFGLVGTVPVTGQDADLTASRRIVAGSQAMTIYKPLKALAETAAEEAVRFAKGEDAQTNGSLYNGKIDVPAYFLDPVVVTRENLDSVIIDSGFHTRADVYGN